MNYIPLNKSFIKKDKSHQQKKIKLTVMCMAYKDDGSFLVENRTKQDWPGLTFPGGHVEDDESIEDAVKREMLEETGLTIEEIDYQGYIEWNEFDDDTRHLAMLFKTKNFKGRLKSSKEGNIFFIKTADLDKYLLSNDFEKILSRMAK